MSTLHKLLIGGGIVLLAAVIGVIFWVGRPAAASPDAQGQTTDEQAVQSGTTPVADASDAGKPELPPWQPPAGSVNVDNYAYTYNSGVYFRSITGTSSMEIPTARADTFRRLTDFMTHPDPAVAQKCGAAGSYAFYGDSKQVFFYQFWRTPEFKASKVEVIKGSSIDTFKVKSAAFVDNGTQALKVMYEVGTTTCSYVLQPV